LHTAGVTIVIFEHACGVWMVYPIVTAQGNIKGWGHTNKSKSTNEHELSWKNGPVIKVVL